MSRVPGGEVTRTAAAIISSRSNGPVAASEPSSAATRLTF
jgi:hypothetical protein